LERQDDEDDEYAENIHVIATINPPLVPMFYLSNKNLQ